MIAGDAGGIDDWLGRIRVELVLRIRKRARRKRHWDMDLPFGFVCVSPMAVCLAIAYAESDTCVVSKGDDEGGFFPYDAESRKNKGTECKTDYRLIVATRECSWLNTQTKEEKKLIIKEEKDPKTPDCTVTEEKYKIHLLQDDMINNEPVAGPSGVKFPKRKYQSRKKILETTSPIVTVSRLDLTQVKIQADTQIKMIICLMRLKKKSPQIKMKEQILIRRIRQEK
ncbi:hypothetical protein ILUMI_02278 [Ignelater luminosus]|uniref:Uncharacterized protein n=1 Tax=Ignelater luminosus TaxID=2038154 RepID=A0A8K0GNC1_IGNLU|nr:hypothetical protein ILUMI_02278 [Ignelater luminosus]